MLKLAHSGESLNKDVKKEGPMKTITYLLLVSCLILGVSTGDARNTVHRLSIAEALAEGEQEGVLSGSISLYFSEQEHPAVDESLGTFTANRKTNAFGKSDEEACRWAFLSAMKSLEDRAIREGGDAVINIYSYYYKNKVESATEFECGAGGLMAGVTMIGEVVKLAE
jgi:uncharacterized protein YbjQ (UPF0145 family)